MLPQSSMSLIQNATREAKLPQFDQKRNLGHAISERKW